MRRRLVLALVVLLAPPRAMADDVLTALLERVAGEHAGAVQVVVGITTPEGRSVTAHPGTAGSAPDGTTLFEIGSLTKVFTGLLLADAVVRGEVAFETPVGDLLPDAASMGGEGPSLLDLATHTSGLPRLPPNLQPRALDNPYADYHGEDLLAVLPSLPRHDTPQPFVYSNLGSGLLGQALAWHAGTDYAILLQARVLKPLGLHETMVDVPPGLAQRRAPAHDATGRPTAYWDFSALAGAGALNASADDLLSLLDAYLDRRPSPLAEAMRQQLANRRAGNAGIAAAAVGWFVEELAGRTIAWHNGSTGGARSFMGFDTTHGIGVVVLTNTTALDVTPLGLRLLRNGLPEAGSFPDDKEVTMLRSMLGGATLGAALAIANPAPVAAQPAATPTAQQASELDQAYRTRAEALIGLFNGEVEPAELFSVAFFQAVPEQQLRRTIAAVTAQHGPAREVEHLDVARDHGSLVVAFGTARLAMRMVLASSAPYAIEGLLITGEAPEPATAAQQSDPR